MAQFRPSAALLVTAIAALAILVAALLTGWRSTERLSSHSASGKHADSLSAAFEVARYAGLTVSASAPRTDFRMTPDSLAGISASIAKNRTALQEQLAILEAGGEDERIAQVRQHVESLMSNVELIESGRPGLLDMLKKRQADLWEFRHGFSQNLDAAMNTSMDDQIYHMMTVYDESGKQTGITPSPISEEVLRLYHLAILQSTQAVAVIKLRAAAVLPFAEMMSYIQEDYESEVRRIETSMLYLSENGAPNLDPEVIPLLQRLVGYGKGENNIWDKSSAKLQLVATEGRQIAANDRILERLFTELDGLVVDIHQRAKAANAAAAQSADTARTILLIIAAIGVAGILLATWYCGSRAGRG